MKGAPSHDESRYFANCPAAVGVRLQLRARRLPLTAEPGDPFQEHALARKYLPLPFACDMVSYGNNIVAQTSEELAGPVAAYLQKGPPFRCLEPPYLHVLDDALEEFGLQVCFMAEYFLPDLHCLRALPVTEPFAFCTRPTLPTCTGEP